VPPQPLVGVFLLAVRPMTKGERAMIRNSARVLDSWSLLI
jgi:hypothetical protein